MFNPFKPKPSVIASLSTPSRGNLTPQTEPLTLHLSGLHCSSCAVNIDLALEDLPSVKSTTNYATQQTKIEYDPSQTTLDQIHFTIRDLGYQIN